MKSRGRWLMVCLYAQMVYHDMTQVHMGRIAHYFVRLHSVCACGYLSALGAREQDGVLSTGTDAGGNLAKSMGLVAFGVHKGKASCHAPVSCNENDPRALEVSYRNP